MIFKVKKAIKRKVAWIKNMAFTPKEQKGVRILMYHSVGGAASDHRFAIRVPVKNFLAQLDEILRQGYKNVALSDLLKRDNSMEDSKIIAITFDDGYKDNFTIAAPALKERGMKATFFVTISYVEARVKKKWLDDRQREFMNWADVEGLLNMGFEVGSHMMDHRDLTLLEEEELCFQLSRSKDKIAAVTGSEPKIFSYPYGKFNEMVIETAKKSGYTAGCSSRPGLNTQKTDRFLLKRTEIDGYDTINDFKRKLSGWYD